MNDATNAFWQSQVLPNTTRTLDLEMMQEAFDRCVVGQEPPIRHLVTTLGTHKHMGKLGQDLADEMLEALAHAAGRTFLGAAAVPLPDWKRAADWVVGGPWPYGPQPIEEETTDGTYGNLERAEW